MAEWIRPVAGPIGAGFGKRVAPLPGGSTNHLGVDIGANNGSPVVAQKAGRVAFAGLAGGFGGLVRVDHDGPDETYAAHMSYISVRYGQYVVQGQALGASGGRRGQWGAGTSTGSHCHVEHRINGVAVDPAPFWTAAAGTGSTPIEPEPEQEADPMYVVNDVNGSGSYIVNDQGATGILGGVQSTIWRLQHLAPGGRLDLQKREIDELDAVLRANARLNAVSIAIPALAAALAPLLKVGATVADIEAALADDFDAIPAAVRARIIKE